jgi:hypothetical protein
MDFGRFSQNKLEKEKKQNHAAKKRESLFVTPFYNFLYK